MPHFIVQLTVFNKFTQIKIIKNWRSSVTDIIREILVSDTCTEVRKVTLRRRTEHRDIVKLFIERFVILGKSVVKLNELGEIYVSKLAETEISNPNYRSENLKVNLEET